MKYTLFLKLLLATIAKSSSVAKFSFALSLIKAYRTEVFLRMTVRFQCPGHQCDLLIEKSVLYLKIVALLGLFMTGVVHHHLN